MRPWSLKISLAALFAVGVYVLLPDVHPVAGKEKAAKKKDKKKGADLPFPPKLPDGKDVHTATSDDFLKAPDTIGKDVLIAKTAPTVDFLFYPCQTYKAKIWSNWGDGLAVNGKYYSSVGDHDAPKGNAYVYEYDPAKKTLRLLTDLVSVIGEMLMYLPGKIHGRLDMGKDGWLYFSTHRGSTSVTTDAYGYKGDWIIKCDPKTPRLPGEGQGVRAEVVSHGPVPKHCIPNSVLDPERMIFYGGTAPGSGKDDVNGVMFFAYDVLKKKVLYSCPDGPPRYMILANSTGKVYYVPGSDGSVGPMMRYDPATPQAAPVKINAQLGLRSATQETKDGMVYTVSKGGKGGKAILYSFNTKTEEAKEIGPAAVGTQDYITSIDTDATGRYVYYIPGAHGRSENDGSAVVQFDTKTKTRKVIAFLHPYFKDKIGAIPTGTFSTALDPAGDKLYVTWNVKRGTAAWDCCALTVIHIPEAERRP